MEETRKSKIPPVRIASDDCPIMVGRKIVGGVVLTEGEAIYPHQGEWVDILPVQTMRESLALTKLIGGASSEDDQTAKVAAARQLVGPFEELCSELSKRVVAWNWTDNDYEPMPSPYKHPEAIKSLSDDELFWIIAAAQGETGAQRKNGSTP